MGRGRVRRAGCRRGCISVQRDRECHSVHGVRGRGRGGVRRPPHADGLVLPEGRELHTGESSEHLGGRGCCYCAGEQYGPRGG
jgi:hypothetical protein